MASSDFDLQSLAAYLHLTPSQVSKMAEKGRLPGRKIGGDWKFSEAEIHHWLEEKIGASHTDELQRYQAVLDRQKTEHDHPLSLGEICPVSRIAVPLPARTRTSVIRTMCELAAVGGLLWDPNQMADAVEAREQLHPTALENGVALMHPRRPQTSILAESVLALGLCSQPIPFSDAGHVTDVFFLICAYDDRSHLRLLARISRLLNESAFLPQLRGASSPQEAHDVLVATELNLFGHG